MGAPNKDYRENCNRSIYVTGPITQELVDKLTPRINELRLSSSDPITAYIDSPGGAIDSAETLRNLIKSPNPDGGRCRLITVVTGKAASAGADFAALGDYAICFSHAEILYHGSRHRLETAVTFEGASWLASNLQATNEFFAVRLARTTFPRLVWRMTLLKIEFQEFLQNPDIAKLTAALEKRLQPLNARLVREATRRQGIIGDLTASLSKHLRRFKSPDKLSVVEFEAAIFKAILAHKIKMHRKEAWLLSVGGLQEVTNDFNLLHDFHFGTQRQELENFSKVYGELFLTGQQAEEYSKLQVSDEEKATWLKQRTASKLESLWYFTVSLCRLLQSADYTLSAYDAYWLGIVDEVPGSALLNIREMFESLAEKGGAAP
jgi:hypothetical protein